MPVVGASFYFFGYANICLLGHIVPFKITSFNFYIRCVYMNLVMWSYDLNENRSIMPEFKYGQARPDRFIWYLETRSRAC